MMQLGQLIRNIQEYTIFGSQNIDIEKIEYDSRLVSTNDLFIAIKGINNNGHEYIQDAIKSGAKCIVLENGKFLDDTQCIEKNVTKIVVKDSSKTMALLSDAYFDYPSRDMKLIGITGTNGKTTTSYLVKSILETSGEKVGVFGTISYKIGNDELPASKTTPESPTIFEILEKMRRKNTSHVVMEVSSHSLALDRVYGIKYDIASFTNLTHDHLDYHVDMDSYLKAKKILFEHNLKKSGIAIWNHDDEYGKKIVSDYEGTSISFGLNIGDVRGKINHLGLDGMSLDVSFKNKIIKINTKLTGKFNAYNILLAVSIGFALEIDSEKIKNGIEKIDNVPGRFQKLKSKKGYWAIVDYSHTPDSLYNALVTIKEILSRDSSAKLITVFGCGGNRDKTKRPKMGKIASDYSDFVFITADNPRDEIVDDIINDILKGVEENSRIRIEHDRQTAIESALCIAKEGDVVLIAGKGHENYQEINGVKKHFDDCEIIQSYFDKE